MNLSKGLGTKVLAGWLIVTGALPLLHVSIPYGSTILALGAIAAGVLILLGK
jgi:hypothetical protein